MKPTGYPRRSVMTHDYHDRSRLQPWQRREQARQRWARSVKAYTHEFLDYPSACALAATDLLAHSQALRAGVLGRLTVKGKPQ